MSVADIVTGLLCLVAPVALMLGVIAALSWSKREFATMLRRWIDPK